MTDETKRTKANAIEIFYSYAHKDEKMRRKLEEHLAALHQQGLITSWHDRMIEAGTEWEQQIDERLNRAHIILLLISASFLASPYCSSIEMKRAMERHEANEARVIPIILRPVDWQGVPFSRLQMLPTGGKPIAGGHWHNQDEAFANVVTGLRKVIEELAPKQTESADGVTGSPPPQTPTPPSSHPIWNIPFHRNPYFTGRDELLARLHDTLTTGSKAALTQPQAISGLGGIGKTQTAIEYAYRYRDEYQMLLWARAETREDLVADVVAMAELLNLPEKNAQEQQITANAVKRWLETHSGWLLILDNADDLTIVRDFLPAGNTGHVLLTTRAQVMGGIARHVEIEKMLPEEETLFLLRRANFIAPDAAVDTASLAQCTTAGALVREMDGLPLALDQAGAYIEETRCGLSGYLDLYRQQRARLLKERGGLVTDHPAPVATTWSLSFQKVAQASPVAADLLRLCAFLAPEAIPEEIIIQGAPDLGAVLQVMAADPIEFNSAVRELLKYSLIGRDPETHTLTVHRLIQAVLKDDMDEDTQRQWAERTVKAVSQIFPDVNFEAWPLYERFLPQALVCETLINHWNLAFSQAAYLLNQAGYYLKDRGHYPEALPLYQRALAIREQELGPRHPDTATSLNNLAELYRSLGQYSEALPLYQRALAIREQELGPTHPDTATSLHNLAALYESQGQYSEALPLYQRALAICEQALGPRHPDTATSLHNLAALYRRLGQYSEALLLLQRALAIYEQALGPRHPFTATSLHNLAGLYRSQGQYSEALPLYQRALAISEQELGPTHPDTAISLNNLALLYQSQGQYSEALPLLQRALAISEQELGPTHPDTVSIRENYTDLLEKIN